VQNPSLVEAGQPAAITLAEGMGNATVEAIDPDGRTHPVPMRLDAGRRVGAMLQTQRTGYYRFRVAATTGEEFTTGFAVNLDVEPDHLSMVQPEEMQRLLGVDAQVARSSEDDPTMANQLANRRELWRQMIWIAFGVVAMEFLLSTLRPQSRRVGADSPSLAAAKSPSWFDRIQWLAGQRWKHTARHASRKDKT
jgi:hypothetical protein